MKKILLASFLVLFSLSSFADDIIKSSKDPGLSVLDLVVGIHQTYSKTSELDAKVVELLGGDGMNPTRMVLILGTGDPMEENRIFELGEIMYEVTRITFLDKDLIVINYTQDTFDQNDRTIQVKRSMEIQALRNNDGELSGEIKILN
ncbi:MAG: hypothetical protein ACXVLQ_03205 [Bacteriovorax sp.]